MQSEKFLHEKIRLEALAAGSAEEIKVFTGYLSKISEVLYLGFLDFLHFIFALV